MESLGVAQIAAALAHEVKNPLSLVRANIDLLELEDGSKHARNFSMIKTELEKIDHLIMEFLSITKPKEDVNDIVYLYDILDNAVAKYSESYNMIDFVLESYDTEVVSEGNYNNLCILIDNVLKNAIESIELRKQGQANNDQQANGKAMPNTKEGVITIDVKEVEAYIKIEIKDTGAGIPEEIIDKIQENFFTTKVHGTGLGINICKKIVKDHGGIFDIKNWDNGAVVTLLLPSCLI